MDCRAQPSPPRQPLPTQHVANWSSKGRSKRIRQPKFSKSFRKLVWIMSFQKLVRSIFRPKQSKNSSVKVQGGSKGGSYNKVFYGPAALYTKQNIVESGGDDYGGSWNLKFGPSWLCTPDASPDLKSLVGRSERFTNVFTGTRGVARISTREGPPGEDTIVRSKHYTNYINNFSVL
ncbi:hypothetical protein RHSIM_Rhsim02G0241600 [Rhododendron simsii]|uniref:Uncharacterized protein n=1 Tax=Rhododendron simsii TaxID=118357 RepID=A0A834HNG7_RHOSS|nr:hypothetical protein RHSIM_Rhsim02G0241600 [Rhododendron simsii]